MNATVFQLSGQLKEQQGQNRKHEANIRDVSAELATLREKHAKLELQLQEKVSERAGARWLGAQERSGPTLICGNWELNSGPFCLV